MTHPIPKLYIKGNVKINGGHMYPEVVRIINVARATAPETEDGAIWITSGAELAPHRLPNSFHYQNQAFDFRVSNVVGGEEAAKRWKSRMALALGGDYDVVWKGNHIHVELDPDTNQENLNG